jgi:hypothetical protein
MNQTTTILSNPTSVTVKSTNVKTPTLITKATVDALIAAQVAKSETEKVSKKAEKEFKTLMVSLFHELFGIKTEDEIKAIDPKLLQDLFVNGMGKDFVFEDGANIQILLSKAGRYPSWKDEFIKATSEAAANLVTINTPEQYSYKVQKA